MTPRLNTFAAASALMKWLEFGRGVQQAGLEASLMELVKIRASQISGCAFCLHMHTAEARKQGEAEERVYLLDAWRESPLYTDRERAALAWTGALTLIAETHPPSQTQRTWCRRPSPAGFTPTVTRWEDRGPHRRQDRAIYVMRD